MHEPLRTQAPCPDGPQGLLRSRPESDVPTDDDIAKGAMDKRYEDLVPDIMRLVYACPHHLARCRMIPDDFNRFCRSLPHTTHVVQWGGSDVWKIGGKVFALGSMHNGQLAISFKCSRMSFDILKDAPGFRPAPYLASRGMIWLQRTSAESVDDEGFKLYLSESHRLVSLGLTKKLQQELGLNQD